MKLSNDLRQSVLQAAMEGKLTKQLKEDGNADDLLGLIEKEKVKLIKEKKIKKTKPLPKISEDEIPFDIPDNWKWVRMGCVGSFDRGTGIKRGEVQTQGRPCIRYGQLYTTYHNCFEKAVSFISEELFKKSHKAHTNDVLMALTGENNKDIALACAYKGVEDIAIGGDMTRFTGSYFNPMYVVIVMNSLYGIKKKSELAKGNIIVHISNDKLASIPFPLPPLSEQHRIVEKVDMLMAEIDELEKKENELEKLKKEFPEDMKASLLQAAMEGKLTKQLKEDGNADDLLESIKKEKEKLIKEKKIKKTKPLPEISKDEIPFDIPDNWRWVRLGNISKLVTKGTTPRGGKVTYLNNGIGFLRAENILGLDKLNLNNLKYVNETTNDTILKRSIIDENDILITIAGTLGRTALVKRNDLPLNANQAISIVRLVSVNEINLKYLIFCLNAPLIQKILIGQRRITAIPNLTLEIIANCIIPIPPLAEQHRIVEKLDELLPLCEELKEDEDHG